jgi:hypothetical protein
MSGAEANRPHVERGWHPPYDERVPVREFKTGKKEEYVQFREAGNAKPSSWLVRAEEVEGLTPAQIKDKLSLPYEPGLVRKVTVPEGTMMRQGKASAMEEFGTRGGAEQFELIDRLPPDSFGPVNGLPSGAPFNVQGVNR